MTGAQRSVLEPVSGVSRRRSGADSGAKVARGEAARTLQLAATLPPGITIGLRADGRRKPYFVRWGANRAVESFADERDRNDRAAKLATEREQHGKAALEVDVARWREFQSFLQRCGGDLQAIEQVWREHHHKARSKFTIRQAITRYMELRRAEDIVKDSDTDRHLKKHLEERLVEAFGDRRLDDVSADDLRAWLHGLKHPDTGAPMSNLTKRHHRKDVNTFWKRAVAEGWCRSNPCALVVPPKVDDEDVETLAARDVFALLKANRTEPVVGRMVFELFGGLRCSSVERLKPELVDTAERGILMPGQLHKSGKRKYRQGHPGALWAWVEHAAPACWDRISAGNYDVEKGRAFIRAGVRNSGNVLRHSFASYLLAATKNQPLVGYLMQHKHTATTEKYEGVAKEADARLVFAMTPAAVVLEWDEFVAQVQAGTLVPDIPTASR